jgi:hypothetical protein
MDDDDDVYKQYGTYDNSMEPKSKLGGKYIV